MSAAMLGAVGAVRAALDSRSKRQRTPQGRPRREESEADDSDDDDAPADASHCGGHIGF